MSLPDIQQEKDLRNIPIKWVGIKDIVLPISLLNKSQKLVPIEANIKLGVGLDKNTRGTHMSRFVETLENYAAPNIYSQASEEYFGGLRIHQFLRKIKKELNAPSAYLKMDFKYFITKKAPVSKKTGVLDYDCSFEGMLDKDSYTFYITVKVPIMTVCPCSKEISEAGAHNQRGFITITVQSPEKDFVWIEDLIELIEKAGSCQIYPLLKRDDEKWVTETSYKNAKFVEDVIRDVVILMEEAGFDFYDVKAETIESIHNHQAFAETDSSIKGNK